VTLYEGDVVELNDRLRGAVWGHLVGDALGVPYEFKDASQIRTVEWHGHGTHNQPAGTWSDDGALMLALLDSQLRKRAPGEARFDTTEQAKRFLAWREDREYTPDLDGAFDIGNATGAAISRFRNGTSAEQAGGTNEGSQGNGSLMRILPIALVERDLPDAELVEHAHRSSSVTHGHPVPQAVCALYVLLARNLLHGQARGQAMQNAQTALREVYEKHAKPETWLGALETIEGWTGRSGRGYVVDSFWSAWDAVAGATSYQDAVERAIKYGGDTDTTACIAGGLAGLRWGVEGIPSEWRTKLRGQDIVKRLVAALVGDPVARPTEVALASQPPHAPAGSRTSATHPIRVDWVEPTDVPASAGWTGRLGMTFLPGRKDRGLGGNHWRDLDADAERLRSEWHADIFVLLVENKDLDASKVEGLPEAMSRNGIELIRYPIEDANIPTDKVALGELLMSIEDRLAAGKRVVVACRGGLGRTGTVVGCLLRDAGLDGPAAMAVTRKSRHDTIENDRQEAFVLGWDRPSEARAT
jgi:ADP-ribosylglycohydrolase